MTKSSRTQSLPLSLPVIDLSIPNFKPELPEWESVKSQVHKAIEEYGCFEVLFNGASMEQRKALFKASEEVFDLPLKTKLSTKLENLYSGYERQNPAMALYEGMGFNGVDNPAVVDDLTRKLCPQGNTIFSKNVHSFAEKMIEVNVNVRRFTTRKLAICDG